MPANHWTLGGNNRPDASCVGHECSTAAYAHGWTLPAHRYILQNLAARVFCRRCWCVKTPRVPLGIIRRAVYPKCMFMYIVHADSFVLTLIRLPRMLRPRHPRLLRPPDELSPQQSDEQRSFCSRPQRRSSSAHLRAPALLFLVQVTMHCYLIRQKWPYRAQPYLTS